MPKMIVVAGPPVAASRRSSVKPTSRLARFHTSTSSAASHGSARQIPAAIRKQANDELTAFCRDHLSQRRTFSFETTLRADFAIRTAAEAHAAGFGTEMHYIAAPLETHIERVTVRALAGGHAASEARLRQMYSNSMENLLKALAVFGEVTLYDNSIRPAFQARIESAELTQVADTLAPWVESTLMRFGEWTARSQLPARRAARGYAKRGTAAHVEPIANIIALDLTRKGVFYDRFDKGEFAIPDLDTHLQHLYHDEPELIVVVISATNQQKMWTGLE